MEIYSLHALPKEMTNLLVTNLLLFANILMRKKLIKSDQEDHLGLPQYLFTLFIYITSLLTLSILEVTLSFYQDKEQFQSC